MVYVGLNALDLSLQIYQVKWYQKAENSRANASN